jgi:hypothetical protein
MPIKLDFPGKEKDEEVILLLRRHPFILVRQNLIYLLYFSIPIVVYVLGKTLFTFILSFPLYPIFILIVSLYYSFFSMFLLIEWIDYYFDAWVITNKRLIDVEQIGLFRRIVSETRLEKIQDVTFEIKGIFGTLFHYGNIHVQTAAEAQRFIFKNIPDPGDIKTKILKLYDERVKKLEIRAQTASAQQPIPSAPTGAPPKSPQEKPQSDFPESPPRKY